MKWLDRIFGVLLVIAALLHGLGSVLFYRTQPMQLLWAEAATLAGLLLAAINLLRAGRPADRPLAWICIFGCLGWLGISAIFGQLIGNLLDFRVVTQLIVTLVLLVLSLRTAFAALPAVAP